MKKNNFYLCTFFMLLSLSVFSQIGNNNFENGFDAGYKETLLDAGITGNYPEFADSRKCQSKNTYINDKKANEKIYADGYRCGVSQASKAIITIKNNNGSPTIEKNQGNLSINDIQSRIDELKDKISSGLAPQQAEAINAQILALEQEKSNLINSTRVKRQTNEQQNEDYQNTIQNNNNKLQSAYGLQQLQTQQANLSQTFSNELSNLSNSMQNVMIADVRKNLLDRQNLISGFYNRNQVKLNKIFSLYNQIPNENFNKKLNGLYKCYYSTQKRYIYANNNEIISVEDCIVNVENNVIKNIYLYGNKEMELDFPIKNPNESKINKGIVTYIDLESLETYRIILLEPYLSSKNNENVLIENKVGYVTLWSNNKNEEGKIVYVQELSADKKQLIREISVKINYAKNEKELLANKDSYPKIAVNVGNVINYLGEITSTPFGNIALHTKTNNSVLKPLESNESRLVEIKKYRE